MVNVITNQEIPDSTDLMSRCGEISPENTVETSVTNACSEHIVDCMGNIRKNSKISLEAAVNEENEESTRKSNMVPEPSELCK